MAAPEGDVTVVSSKPSRLAPLKKSPTSKASVESFFRVSNDELQPDPVRGPRCSAGSCRELTRARPQSAQWMCVSSLVI